MPQPRGCRGSSKVRAVNSISRICRFPSPIKTHFFVFGCAESEKNFTSVGIFHRSGKGRGKFRERYAADSPAERFFPLRRRDSNGKHCFFPACPHDGVFRRLISGNTEKTKRALCALCTQRPFLLSLISARKRAAFSHCPSEISMPSDEKLRVIGELIFTVPFGKASSSPRKYHANYSYRFA